MTDCSTTLVNIFKFLSTAEDDSHLIGALDNLANLQIKKESVPQTFADVMKILYGMEDKVFLVKIAKLAKSWEKKHPEVRCLLHIFLELNANAVRLVKEILSR